MKYPKFNKKDLDSINKRRFTNLYNIFKEQIDFDNNENEMNLSKSDIELLSWNSAVRIIIQPY